MKRLFWEEKCVIFLKTNVLWNGITIPCLWRSPPSKKEGYVEDFNVYFWKWAWKADPDLKVEDMDVIQYYQFEGMTNRSRQFNSVCYWSSKWNERPFGWFVCGKTSNLPEESCFENSKWVNTTFRHQKGHSSTVCWFRTKNALKLVLSVK